MDIHEETLKIARSLMEKDPNLTDWVISKFPELKESEDEKIRKAIIHFISHTPTVPKGIIGKEIMIAWLEKQSESTLVEEIKRRKELLLSEKEKAVSVRENVSLGGRISMLEELLAFVNEKQDKKKPKEIESSPDDLIEECNQQQADDLIEMVTEKSAWSEEDERLFQIVIDILDRQNHLGKLSHTDLIACVRELKSLKQRIGE